MTDAVNFNFCIPQNWNIDVPVFLNQQMTDAVVDFLIDDLKQILENLILAEKYEIQSLYDNLEFIRLLKNSWEHCFQHEDLERTSRLIGDLICSVQVLNELDSFIASEVLQKDETMAAKTIHIFDRSPKLEKYCKRVEVVKKKMMEVDDARDRIEVAPQEVGIHETLLRRSDPLVEEETLVGIDDEATTIIERLTTQLQKQLEVVSIVGMAGLGKTTLASRVYNDPFVVYHFYIRGWAYVSQVYREMDVFRDILSCVLGNKDDVNRMEDEELGEALYKSLKGRRYLIVLDDIWNTEDWDDLKRFFPNDRNGSRIMLTTRLTEVALRANPNGDPPHCMRFLDKNESWDLLQNKAFRNESCPPELMEIGKRITAQCRGLPLAIRVVAGLLANKEKTRDWWEKVAQSVTSFIVGEPEQNVRDVLALSYGHLPHWLKSCFLYFAAFPIGCEIPVWKLTRLWIAQGFIAKDEQKSLEDVAEDYLMGLIDRCLVLVGKKRSGGGIRTCSIHDLLHDLCVRKALEKNLLHRIKYYSASYWNRYLGFISPVSTYGNPGMPSSSPCSPPVNMIFFWLLRVLDISEIPFYEFPSEVPMFVHLRYLALKVSTNLKLPPSISNLWNLETLVCHNCTRMKRKVITLPHSIWKLVKLTHLGITENMQFEDDRSLSVLDNLQTISLLRIYRSKSNKPTPDWEMAPKLARRNSLISLRIPDLRLLTNEEVLARTPNLRKLGLFLPSTGCNDEGYFFFPDLSSLDHLETLKFRDFKNWKLMPSFIPRLSEFPPNLKKLSLSGSRLNWNDMTTIGMLPNLEVLKLKNNYFQGPLWETSEGGFCRLIFLKLSWMDLKQWIASSDHFPSLQRLVLHRCKYLKQIPFGLGDIPTLQMIEIYWSSRSAANSARQIQEEQKSMGNDGLKILIYPSNKA